MRLSRLAVLLAVLTGLSVPAGAQYTTKTATSSGFTTKQAGTTARPTAGAAKTAAQPVFRPRPQESKTAQNNADDDELPSFDALEGKTGSAQGQANVPPPPPPPPPRGEVWFYISDFEYRDLTGMTMNCGWKVVLQNRTDTALDNLELLYQLLDEEFLLYAPPVAAGASAVVEHAAPSPKCPAMAHVRPKINVKKCKFGGLTNQECAPYIIVK